MSHPGNLLLPLAFPPTVPNLQTGISNRCRHLVHGTENVGIILLEPAHPRQPSQGPRGLIAMQYPKISQAEGQLPPGSRAMAKHKTTGGKRAGTEIE